MYPYIRMAKEFFVHRNASPLPFDGVHVSHHRCWPWDIDPWMELNNGRTLTLYDLGRLPLARRTGLIRLLRDNGWFMTMAGVVVRYRRRIPTFQKFTTKSRCIGWDDKFFYIDQSMWLGDTCAGQAVYRAAIVGKSGIVAPPDVIAAKGGPAPDLTLPDWVQDWIAAEAKRPWPPEF